MGFLDRVKASFSQAMGGKASLDLELAQATVAPGDTLDYRVVLVTTGPLNADRLTVGLYGRERIRVWTSGLPPSAAAPSDSGGLGEAGPSAPGLARESTTAQHVETVAGAELSLAAGQTREFRGSLQVPADAQPTYRGVDAQHTWCVRAVVVVPLGVDVVAEADVTIR
jgi:hypothetical protein